MGHTYDVKRLKNKNLNNAGPGGAGNRSVCVCVCVCGCESAVATAMSAGCRLVLSPRWRRGPVPRLRALLWARGGSPSRCRTM